MKQATTALALLGLATTAAAHSSSLPHTHHGSETSWLPAIACVAALALVGYLVFRIRRARSAK